MSTKSGDAAFLQWNNIVAFADDEGAAWKIEGVFEMASKPWLDTLAEASYPFVAPWLSHSRGGHKSDMGRLVILMRMIRDYTDNFILLNHCATPGTKHL